VVALRTPRKSDCSRDPSTTPLRSSRRAISSMVARLSRHAASAGRQTPACSN
jgi:hypothetical protein